MGKDKIFCGNGKGKKCNNGTKYITAFLNIDALSKSYNEHGFMSNRDERTMKIVIWPVKDKPGDFYLEVDTWKPANPADTNPKPHPQAQQPPPIQQPPQQQQGQGQQGAPPPSSASFDNDGMAADYDQAPYKEQGQQQPPPQQQQGAFNPNVGSEDDIPL